MAIVSILRIVCLLSLSFLWITGVSQTIVYGRVYDSDKQPLTGVNVMIKNTSNRIITFSQTDNEGKFSLELNNCPDSVFIYASSLGYKPFSKLLIKPGEEYNICLEEGSLQLGEITVRSKRIRERGDTISYNVAGFAQKQDKSIGDVMKRMPGIEVDKSGKIQYQGIDINKFYIEGSDILGGRYGIATKGISHEDVGSVEILENHQPMQVLRGLSLSEKAAVNLRLKNSSRTKFLVHGLIGGGLSENPKEGMWDGEIFAMMIAGKCQTITTVQGNDTGKDLSDQLADFTTAKNDENDLENYISLPMLSTPNLEPNHTYFNRSWMISTNHLIKLDKKGELKARVDYSNDKLENRYEESTIYLIESGNKTIVEKQTSLTHTKSVTGDFEYEANEKNYFLKNRLLTDVVWNNQSASTSGTLPNTQILTSPKYSISNSLTVLKKTNGKKLISFDSFNGWKSLPETLIVTDNIREYGQRITQHSFYSNQHGSMGFLIKNMSLFLEGGLSGYFRNLDTVLWGIKNDGLSTGEITSTNYINSHLSPRLEWDYRRVGLKLSIPVNTYTYFFSQSVPNLTKVFFSPTVTMRLSLNPRLGISIRASFRNNPQSLHKLYRGYILTDYRSFSSGLVKYMPTSGKSISMTTTYRDIRKGLFISLMANQSWSHSKSGIRQEIVDDYIINSYSATPTNSNNTMIMWSINKTLDFVRGGTGMKGSYIHSGTMITSQSVLTNRAMSNLALTSFIHGNLFYLLNWDIKFTWNYGKLNLSNIPILPTNNFVYTGGITLTPHHLITWTAVGEYYRNQFGTSQFKDIFMLDSKISLNISRKIELSFTVNNLLNHKTYNYTTFGNLSETEHSSSLRGREFLVTIYLKK